MNLRKVAVLAFMLTLAGGIVGLVVRKRDTEWKRAHPPIRAQDLRLRRVLMNAHWGAGAEQEFSTAQRTELAEHFWTATSPHEAQGPIAANGTQVELYFHPSRPGQGTITLNQDPAWDALTIEWWHEWPRGEEGKPMLTQEESYELHPATSRFLREWLAHQK